MLSMQHGYTSYLLIPILSLLLGCTGNSKVHAEISEMSQAAPSNSYRYAEQIKKAITAELPDTKPYEGKKCTISLLIAPDGLLLSAKSESGDTDFCEVAVSAATRAKIPPAPDNETWQRFKNIVLVFSP